MKTNPKLNLSSLHRPLWQVARIVLALLILVSGWLQMPPQPAQAAPLAGFNPNTSTTITYVSPEPSGTGKSATIGYYVSYTSGPLMGSVDIYVDGFLRCSSTQLPAGACAVVFSGPGTYTLRASYDASSDLWGHDSSISASVMHTVLDMPEADLFQGGMALASGVSYDFGSQSLNTTVEKVFTLNNSGNRDLTLTTPLTLGGADADQFSLEAQPVSPVSPAGSTPFTVRFAPTSTGLKTATLSIPSNDYDENPYLLTLQGTSIVPPEINLLGGGLAIANGEATPSVAKQTDFGVVPVGQSASQTYTIENTGIGPLTLSGSPRVELGGVNAEDFNVTLLPASPVAVGGSTTFQVTFLPSGFGTRATTVSLANDDPDENPYQFSIQGSGVCSNAIVVTNANDSGHGSLREAVAGLCSGGTITFNDDDTITLSSTLVLDKDLTIDGAGHTVTLSGGNEVRVLEVSSPVVVNLKNLTVTKGYIHGVSPAIGGGLYNHGGGQVTLTNCTFSENISFDAGGGIYNAARLTIIDSTLSKNQAFHNGGGGVWSLGSLFISGSTFLGNSASEGGGLYTGQGGGIFNSTFSGNQVYNYEGGISLRNSTLVGSMLYLRRGNLSYFNSLLSDCFNESGLIFSNQNNLVVSGRCSGGDVSNFKTGDPLLGPLGNYGGPTQTYALLPGSPAIDAGSGCLASDQRGISRPQGAACDIGAFESQGFALAIVSGDDQDAFPGADLVSPLQVQVTAKDPAEPVDGGLVTFTAPTSGAGITLGATSALISGGLASVTATANDTLGSYTVNASLGGSGPGLAFALTNLTAPTVTTGAATGLTVSGATLNGTVNANDTETIASFEYGPDASYGTTVSASPATLTGSTATAIHADLSGLAPNITYHFRAVGATAVGTVHGLDATFTTPCASAITVTNANDSGAGSLRQAIASVCVNGTIDFDGDYTLHLASQLSITKGLTIDGSGHSVTISGDSDNDGAGDVRVFWVQDTSANAIILDKLKIVKGAATADNGGGLYLVSGNLFVQNSTFSGNSATTGAGDGGGLYNAGGILDIQNSTFADNFSGHNGGAIFSHSNLLISRSTFSGNKADLGGGIYSEADLSIERSTFSGNVARFTYGGGLYTAWGSVTLYNTLIANSATQISGDTPVECYLAGGGPIDASNSLIEDGTCGALLSGDPLLAPLGNYGGLTQTFALLPGSPAIDAGLGCSSAPDQRGAARVGNCDLGAFESQGFKLGNLTGTPQSTAVGTAFATPLGLTVTANDPVEPVDGGQITFTPPGPGASAVVTGSPAAISGGVASVTATANGTTGPYNVTASARGVATDVDFALTNIAAPGLSINAVSLSEGQSGAATFTFTVSLSAPALAGGVTFDIATADGTASAPTDYTAQSLTGQTIPAGSSTYTFTVTVNGDTTVETDETFLVNVTNVTGATVTDGQGQGTLTNDDFVPTVTTNPATAISQTGATLNGAVNANGADTTVTIEYWQGSNPATTVSATPSPVTGSSVTTVSSALTGLTPNTTYIYHVIGVSAVDMAQGADVSFTTGAQAPSVTTIAASAITIDGATLNGTVNAQNDSTTVSFEYGSTTGYGITVTAAQSPVTGATDAAVSYNLTGLTPNTTYHYRVVGVNSVGTILGSDRTFTTLALGVVITTEIHGASAHTPLTFAALGDSLHAMATVTGNGPAAATGSVAFASFANPTCAGTGKTLGAKGLVGTVADDLTLSDLLTVNGLSFKARYLGDANYPATDGPCVSISTSQYPTVLTLSANALPQDGSILTSSPANLQIQFSRDVLHGSASDSAENPANYLLVAPGANGTFDTQSCGPASTGGLKPDDTQITVDSVSYDPATYLAKLTVNGGASLPNGTYRLFVCGTTSIIDAAGTAYLNNHTDDSRVTFTVAISASSSGSGGSHSSKSKKLPATGFAPNAITLLPVQPAEKAYAAEGMWLEIPALGLKQSIVGVPGPDWDVTWLGKKIGYLEGTAFPTWNGNSVLTGHVTDANGKPGPFASLGTLSWGSQVIIHAWGQAYTYEVRTVNLWTDPNSTSALTRHEDLPWLTLITCHGYDEKTDTYRWRTIVRAVLVKMK